MTRAEVRLGGARRERVSPYMFGSLTEHFGYGIYGGLWDLEREVPRADVAGAARSIGQTMFRYPGGCFSDWYHWRDGVGPRDRRPTHEETYWTTFELKDQIPPALAREFGPRESNAFGTNELLDLCIDLDVEPMLVANFGTGTPTEAADWVRYCNVDRNAPRPVKWWSVGNETYGEWELGHCSAAEYAKRYVEFSQQMRAVDPDIHIIAVGTAHDHDWNATVLREAADHVDALSVHWYFPGPGIGRSLRDDEADWSQIAAGSDGLGRMLDNVITHVDEVTGPDRALPLSLDEWNMWVQWTDLLHANHRLCDGVFFAGCFNRMLERAGRVRFSMISHLVNCMAPIQTDGDRHFLTSSGLVSMLYSRTVRDQVMDLEVSCDDFRVTPFGSAGVPTSHVEVAGSELASAPLLDASATTDERGVTVYLANRSLDQELAVTVAGLPPGASGRFRHLRGEGPFVRNDVDNPFRIRFGDLAAEVGSQGVCMLRVPPHTAGALVVETVPTAHQEGR